MYLTAYGVLQSAYGVLQSALEVSAIDYQGILKKRSRVISIF